MKKQKSYPSNKLSIEMYIHCALCFSELDTGEINASPKEYQRIQAGWSIEGLQIWCTRHQTNIIHIDFEGVKHPANTTREDVETDPN